MKQKVVIKIQKWVKKLEIRIIVDLRIQKKLKDKNYDNCSDINTS